MNSIFKTLSFLCFLLFSVVLTTKAQEPLMPQASSGQTIIQDFGLGKVTLNYSRPNVKGRSLFGGLIPYGEVWRTGANSATTISFTDDVVISGKTIPAGKYGLFTIPGKEEWIIIFNKTYEQWGAYAYKKEDDVLRITVKPITLKTPVESFTIQFESVTAGDMILAMIWDKTMISVPLHTNYDAKVMDNIDKAMQGEKKPYFAAAQYYYTNDKDISKAIAWINEAEKADAKGPWIKLWKAKILLKAGDKKGAALSATEGINAAKAINNAEYIKLNQEFLNSIK